MTDAVCLHIGVPKSGTTFIQEVLWTNLDRLRDLGWTMAATSFPEHARAGGDLIGTRTGRLAASAWDRQVERIHSTETRVVLSYEHLVQARSPQTARAVTSLAPSRVTIVITARDLARQILSAWQQKVKERFTATMAEFADGIVHRRPAAAGFWAEQDVLAALDAWLTHLQPERVVVVTVPPAGNPPELLWQRFAGACGIDPIGFDLNVATPNESLGAAQTELLRRVNVALGDRLALDDGYRALVRRFVANDLLAGQLAYERFGVDEATHTWATEAGNAVITGLHERGVTVVGDPADLVPAPFAPSIDPAAIDERTISAAATELLADLLAQWQERGRAMPRPAADRAHDAGARLRPSIGMSERPGGRHG